VFNDLLVRGCEGIWSPTPLQVGQLHRHYEMLVRWNKILNLTSVREERDIIERHFLESIFLGSYLPEWALRIADIGSGAGFPGIPVAIMRPASSVTLIESHQRKAAFLKEVARELLNTRVIAARAEDVEEEFDWAISRAVAPDQLAPALRRARNALLLAGDSGPELIAGFTWEPPIKLPWGKQRYIWSGSAVSRET
jgi:16S rRNA (guanine527-N7)-methyltransferase